MNAYLDHASGADAVVSRGHGLWTVRPERPASVRVGLTPRQIQVLALIAQGKSNKSIARELGLALGTVKCHVAMLLRTLNVATRTQAALLACHTGLAGRHDPQA